MDDLRRIGYSDKVFQYKPSRNLRIRVVLKKPLELHLLKDAVSKALDECWHRCGKIGEFIHSRKSEILELYKQYCDED